MKKNKAKAAAKVDALLAEAFTNDEARMQQIREQAHAELLRRTAEQPVKTKKKGLCYSVPALCALVIILIVAPVVAIIANPVGYSKANQLVRKATVWVNDTFKLGIELPVEEGETIKQESVTVAFETAAEAAAYLDRSLLVIEEKNGNKLTSVEITDHSGVMFITQNYEYNGEKIRLSMETVLERFVGAPTENAIQIDSEIGTFWAWMTNDVYRAVGIIDNWSVDLRACVDIEEIQNLLGMIRWFN